jgi:Flp pilus assembly protein TadD
MGNQRLLKILDILSYVFVLINIVAVPVFIDKNLFNFYIIPKQYVFIGLLLFNLFFFAAKIVLSKKITFKNSVLDLPMLGFLLVALLSSLFSSNVNDSFLGRNEFFMINFVYLFFSFLFYFIFVNTIDTQEKWRGVLDALLGVGGFCSLLFIVKTLFGLNLPWLGGVWNVVDGTNSAFGLWLIVMFVLSAGLLIRRNIGVSRALFYFFIMLLSVVPLFIMGFSVLWWMLLIAIVLLLLLGASFMSEARTGWLSVLFAMLIMACVFIIFGSPRSLQSVLPVEVALDVKPSWSITKGTVFSGFKNFLLGSGLGTFATDFSKYRTADFNTDQVAWSLRFNQPYNSYFAIMAEGGILLTLGFLFILLFVMGQVFNTWFKARGERQDISSILQLNKNNIKMDVFLVVIAWLVLWVGMAINFFSVPLWTLWWLFLGLIITGLFLLGHNVIKERTWTMEDTPQYNLAFSFGLIVLMALVVMVGIQGVRFYWAETVYAKSLSAQNYESASGDLQKAITLHGNSDVYHVALAKTYLVKAAELSRVEKPNVQEVAGYVAQAVNEARSATDISPASVAIWENLAMMYENATLLVPEAGSWAIKSLDTAIALEPSNPVLYWRMGNNYAIASNLPKAIEYYQKAIELKSDYVGAYVSLSAAYEANKEMDKAVETYGKIMSVAASNPEALFNYGRLLYNRNQKEDRNNAEKLWLQAVNLQPGYSNALYSLGLLYESRGDKAKALQYYYKVKDLNPDNKDISAKIKSLVGGTVESTPGTTTQ